MVTDYLFAAHLFTPATRRLGGLLYGLLYGLLHGLLCGLLCGLLYGLLRGSLCGLLCALLCALTCPARQAERGLRGCPGDIRVTAQPAEAEESDCLLNHRSLPRGRGAIVC